MQKKNFKLRLLKWMVISSLMIMLIAITALIIYAHHLSVQIEERFSTRLWRIPSRVFSDTTLLFPGQRMNMVFFNEKLKDLGYREVHSRPEYKGEMRNQPSGAGVEIELFLKDLHTPSRKRDGFPVRIKLMENRITSINHLDNGMPIPIMELEPEEIMLFFGPEREQRQLVSINQVPPHLIFAILAAEDNRFYEHHGIDPRGILRAIYVNLRHGTIKQGGSTITQQLTKNFFLTPEKTIPRKLKELLMSLIIEIKYEKNEVMEIYLNEIYLGQKGSVSINGVGEASYFYFGKPVSELSVIESATIAGLIRAPNFYSPYSNLNRCRKRRNIVLHAMHKNDWILDETLSTGLQSSIKTIRYTTYGKKAPYFMDYLSRQITKLYPTKALSSLGLSIFTTLDTQVQKAAERALKKGLERLEKSNQKLQRKSPEKRLQGAIIVMRPKTGAILAMVGGRNYGLSQFNRITQAKRQPGSTFKPFVFVSGLDEFTPSTMLSNIPRSYSINGKSWRPKNFSPIQEDQISLRSALARSANIATVDLAVKIGLDHIVENLRAFQFSTPIRPLPSLSLGAFEVIPLELARSYCVFAADGLQPNPLSLKEVVDENGNILEQRHMNIERLISPAKAFIMSSMLKSVVTDGTARALKNKGILFPVAGKTGTTSNFNDAWFVGYTPDILALVWVGFDRGGSIHTTGSGAAMSIWADLMRAVPQYISGAWFAMPPGVVKLDICRSSGFLAVPNRCPELVEEFFLEGNQPAKACPTHRPAGLFEKIKEGVKNFIDQF